MAISDTIDISVSGIGEVNSLADALDKAAQAAGRLDELAGKGISFSGAASGLGELEKSLGRLQGQADALNKSLADLGQSGVGGDAGAAGLGKLDDALKGASEQANALAVAGGRVDDSLKGLDETSAAGAGSVGKLADSLKATSESAAGLKDTAPLAADGIKGIGAGAGESAAAIADFNKVMAESSAMQVEMAANIGENWKSVAAGQRVSSAAAKDASDEAIAGQAAQSRAAKQAAADTEATAGKYHMLALGSAVALGYGIDQAAKLQTMTTRLYTTAGESAANLPLMSAGILALSGQTNTSQAQLGQGAYMVESAGYHGKDALGVLKAAAEGAQAEGAPLGDTANALTSLMNAYGVPKGKTASQAAMTDMDQIIAMVSRGKMTMAGAVGALPDVLPAASAAKLSFADVGGALSTMTSMGVSPDRAAQNLSHVITSIMSPNAVQTKEQQQLGLNPVQIQNDLGSQGLTGTLTELSSTVMKNMGPAGDVLFKTFNQSRSAAADANTMIAAMPSSIRGVAQSYADGSISAAKWNAEIFKGTESAQQKNMLQQFATVENSAKGFNELLKTGSPAVQTYAAAMSKLLGGQTGLNVAMELTGQHMPVMKANTDAIAAAAQHAGANVAGWSKVQQTLNFQLGSAVKSLEAVATEAGQVALPAVTGILHGLGAVTGFAASHPAVTQAALGVGGILGAGYAATKVESAGATALQGVGKIAQVLHIPGLDKLANLGQSSGAGQMAEAAAGNKGAADTMAAAAGRMQGAADTMAGASAGNEKAAETQAGASDLLLGVPGKKGTATAAAEEDALAEGAGGASLLSKIGIGGIGDLILPAIGVAVVDSILKNTKTGPHGQNAFDNPFGANPNSKNPRDQGLSTWAGLGDAILGAFGIHTSTPVSGGPQSVAQQAQQAFRQAQQQAAHPGKDWTSVTGGSAPYSGAPVPGVPASRFALPPGAGTSPVAGLPTYDATGRPVSYGPASVLGTGGRPGTATAPAPATTGAALLGAGGHPSTVKIPAPDDSALVSAKAKIQADLNAIKSALAMSALHPGTLPAPDISALQTAKGKVQADLNQINQAISKSAGHPAAIPAPSLAALTAAAGRAGAAASALTGEVQAALKAARVPAPDLSALTGARPKAVTAGQSVGGGFAAGISAETGAVEAAAGALAADAAAAMHVTLKATSPSKVTHDIGANEFDAGFAQGIIDGGSSVKAATAQIGSQSVASLLQTLVGGSSNIQAAISAVMGAASNPDAVSTIQQGIQTLIGDVPAKDTGLVKYLHQQSAKLQAEANKQGALMTQISNAQQVATSQIGSASITSAYGYTPALAASGGPLAAQSTLTGLGQEAGDQKQYAKVLAGLKKAGLNATSLSQLAQEGAAAGLPEALGLLQGGKGSVKQANQYEAQIIKASQSIGGIGGTAMYGAQQAAMGGLDTALKKQLTTLDTVMSKEANAVIAHVEKALGTGKASSSASTSGTSSTSAASSAAASASASTAGVGKLSAAAGAAASGLDRVGPASGSAASGLIQVGPAASAAASALGKVSGMLSGQPGGSSSPPGRMQPMGGGGYSGGSGGSAPAVHVTHNHTWNIQGSVMSEGDLVQTVQNGLLRLGSRNWNQGTTFPGRHN